MLAVVQPGNKEVTRPPPLHICTTYSHRLAARLSASGIRSQWTCISCTVCQQSLVCTYIAVNKDFALEAISGLHNCPRHFMASLHDGNMWGRRGIPCPQVTNSTEGISEEVEIKGASCPGILDRKCESPNRFARIEAFPSRCTTGARSPVLPYCNWFSW